MGGGSREGGVNHQLSSVGEGRSKLIFATERGYNIILSRMLPISQHPPPPLQVIIAQSLIVINCDFVVIVQNVVKNDELESS